MPSALPTPNPERRTPNATAASQPISPQTLLPHLQAKWDSLARAALSDGQLVLATALTDSTPVALANGMLTVELPADLTARLTADPELAKRLDELVSRIAGCPLHIVPRARSGQGPGIADDRARRYRAAQEHPLMKALLQHFEADIVARELIGHDAWLAGFGKKKARIEQEPEPGSEA